MDLLTLKKKIDTAYDEFVESLGSAQSDVTVHLKVPLEEFLDEQRYIDRSIKRLMKTEFKTLLKLYLRRVDLPTLSDKIKVKEKHFLRAFGKDKLNHLKLLVDLKMSLETAKPRKGLLAV